MASDRVKVIGILGPSYCGSTVISYVLNTDPAIYGGSELRRLVQQNRNVRCDLCRHECPRWTSQNIEMFSAQRDDGGIAHFYRKIAAVMETSLIADASKMALFFTEAFLAAEEQDGVQFMFVLPVKHPIRFFASLIYNDHFRGRVRDASGYDKIRAALTGAGGDEVLSSFVPKAAEYLRTTYGEFFERFTGREGRPLFTLKHESFAGPGGAALLEGMVREALGYSPTLDLERYPSYEAHPIGGNRGPYWQARVERDREFSVSDPRFQYYQERRGVRRDVKFGRVLPRTMIERLLELGTTRELAHMLSYSDDELFAILHEYDTLAGASSS